MLASDNLKTAPALPADATDLTIGDLLGVLASHKDKPLVFRYGGRPVKPGYHVTEVKAGQFSALDCGAKSRILVGNLHPALGRRRRRTGAHGGRQVRRHHRQGGRPSGTGSIGEADLRGQRRYPPDGALPGKPADTGWRHCSGRAVATAGKLQAARPLASGAAARRKRLPRNARREFRVLRLARGIRQNVANKANLDNGYPPMPAVWC